MLLTRIHDAAAQAAHLTGGRAVSTALLINGEVTQ